MFLKEHWSPKVKTGDRRSRATWGGEPSIRGEVFLKEHSVGRGGCGGGFLSPAQEPTTPFARRRRSRTAPGPLPYESLFEMFLKEHSS